MSISIKLLKATPLASIADVELLDFCFCGRDCYDSYIEYAFTGSASDEDWKKDKSSFLFRKLRSADTIALELWKAGVKVADISDNTYGKYYPTFTAQSLYVGFVADWSLIASAFGNGYYQIKAQKTILGQSSIFESRQFFVLPYSDERADETVRLETFTTGNIIRSDLDYSELIEGGWYQSIRFRGRFGNVTPTIETDKLQTTDRKILSVQDKIINEYTLFTDYLPESVKSQIVNEQLLNNRCLITDYNLLNDEVIRQKPVYLTDIPTTNHINRGTAYEFSFSDEFDNLLIRNK